MAECLEQLTKTLLQQKYLFSSGRGSGVAWDSPVTLARVFQRLLSVYSNALDFEGDHDANLRHKLAHVHKCLRLLEIGHLAPKVKDLSDKPKALRIISALDDKISGCYESHVVARRVRVTIKKEEQKQKRQRTKLPVKDVADKDHIVSTSLPESCEPQSASPREVPNSSSKDAATQESQPRVTETTQPVHLSPQQQHIIPSGRQLQRTPVSSLRQAPVHLDSSPKPVVLTHTSPLVGLTAIGGDSQDDRLASPEDTVVLASQQLPRPVSPGNVPRDNIIPTGHQLPRTPKPIKAFHDKGSDCSPSGMEDLSTTLDQCSVALTYSVAPLEQHVEQNAENDRLKDQCTAQGGYKRLLSFEGLLSSEKKGFNNSQDSSKKENVGYKNGLHSEMKAVKASTIQVTRSQEARISKPGSISASSHQSLIPEHNLTFSVVMENEGVNAEGTEIHNHGGNVERNNVGIGLVKTKQNVASDLEIKCFVPHKSASSDADKEARFSSSYSSSVTDSNHSQRSRKMLRELEVSSEAAAPSSSHSKYTEVECITSELYGRNTEEGKRLQGHEIGEVLSEMSSRNHNSNDTDEPTEQSILTNAKYVDVFSPPPGYKDNSASNNPTEQCEEESHLSFNSEARIPTNFMESSFPSCFLSPPPEYKCTEGVVSTPNETTSFEVSSTNMAANTGVRRDHTFTISNHENSTKLSDNVGDNAKDMIENKILLREDGNSAVISPAPRDTSLCEPRDDTEPGTQTEDITARHTGLHTTCCIPLEDFVADKDTSPDKMVPYENESEETFKLHGGSLSKGSDDTLSGARAVINDTFFLADDREDSCEIFPLNRKREAKNRRKDTMPSEEEAITMKERQPLSTRQKGNEKQGLGEDTTSTSNNRKGTVTKRSKGMKSKGHVASEDCKNKVLPDKENQRAAVDIEASTEKCKKNEKTGLKGTKKIKQRKNAKTEGKSDPTPNALQNITEDKKRAVIRGVQKKMTGLKDLPGGEISALQDIAENKRTTARNRRVQEKKLDKDDLAEEERRTTRKAKANRNYNDDSLLFISAKQESPVTTPNEDEAVAEHDYGTLPQKRTECVTGKNKTADVNDEPSSHAEGLTESQRTKETLSEAVSSQKSGKSSDPITKPVKKPRTKKLDEKKEHEAGDLNEDTMKQMAIVDGRSREKESDKKGTKMKDCGKDVKKSASRTKAQKQHNIPVNHNKENLEEDKENVTGNPKHYKETRKKSKKDQVDSDTFEKVAEMDKCKKSVRKKEVKERSPIMDSAPEDSTSAAPRGRRCKALALAAISDILNDSDPYIQTVGKKKKTRF